MRTSLDLKTSIISMRLVVPQSRIPQRHRNRKGERNKLGQPHQQKEEPCMVTMVYTINPSGNVLPRMFLFPKKNFRDHFTKRGPTGCIGQANETGWINKELFLDYLGHLLRHTRCSKERNILLILANHDSHIPTRN